MPVRKNTSPAASKGKTAGKTTAKGSVKNVSSSREGKTFCTHTFGPFYRPDSEILILGSFPSVKSREANFYYGHPQNRFWKILAAYFKDSVPGSTEEKSAFLASHKVALYDVIDSCWIKGSSDSSITDPQLTDLAPIIRGTKIDGRIFTNGKTAFRLYEKYTRAKTGIPARLLPSSSPANAAFSLDKLAALWGEAFRKAGFYG
jgi:TDG/mug DNA glycosylase family protein